MTEEPNVKKDLYKQFNQLLKAKVVEDTDDLPMDEQFLYMTPDNVAGIVPKKVWAKKYIEENFDVENPNKKWESLLGRDKYKSIDMDVGFVQEAKYDCTYIKKILEIAKSYDSVKIRMKKDFPITVETVDFLFILAPKVHEDF